MRPYFVIYEEKNFMLAFPETTRPKRKKGYSSHKNPLINGSKIILDQLQLFSKEQIQSILTYGFVSFPVRRS